VFELPVMHVMWVIFWDISLGVPGGPEKGEFTRDAPTRLVPDPSACPTR
jgi:hypothetical protein